MKSIFKIILALLALVTISQADLSIIIVEGTFDQSVNRWWWGEDPIMDLATDYSAVCAFEKNASDQAPWDSTYGEYVTEPEEGGICIMDFYSPSYGIIHLELPGSEVHVRRNYESLKGITFGNLEEQWDSGNTGLWYPEYFGFYFSFLVPNSYGGTVSDDSLAQVPALQGVTAFEVNSYGYLDGFNDDVDPEFRVTLQDHTLSYTVEE